jgi:hypothetical protein
LNVSALMIQKFWHATGGINRRLGIEIIAATGVGDLDNEQRVTIRTSGVPVAAE